MSTNICDKQGDMRSLQDIHEIGRLKRELAAVTATKNEALAWIKQADLGGSHEDIEERCLERDILIDKLERGF